MAGPEVEQMLRGIPGVVACSVEGRRAHVLCGPGRDHHSMRRAARTAAPGYRITVVRPDGRDRGPMATVLGEMVPVLVVAGAAVGAAGAGAYLLHAALTPDGPEPAPAVAVEMPPPPSGHTVVPAPAGETAVLGEVIPAGDDVAEASLRPRFVVHHSREEHG